MNKATISYSIINSIHPSVVQFIHYLGYVTASAPYYQYCIVITCISVHNNYGKRSIKYKASSLWNQLYL